MEEILSKLKFSILILIIPIVKIFAIEALVATVDIPYKKRIIPAYLTLKNIKEIPYNCELVTIEYLKNSEYLSNKFIKKDKVLCKKDLKAKGDNSVIFRFGSIEIETDGKILFENDEYIRIKRSNGKIEKIYKDGRLR